MITQNACSFVPPTPLSIQLWIFRFIFCPLLLCFLWYSRCSCLITSCRFINAWMSTLISGTRWWWWHSEFGYLDRPDRSTGGWVGLEGLESKRPDRLLTENLYHPRCWNYNLKKATRYSYSQTYTQVQNARFHRNLYDIQLGVGGRYNAHTHTHAHTSVCANEQQHRMAFIRIAFPRETGLEKPVTSGHTVMQCAHLEGFKWAAHLPG